MCLKRQSSEFLNSKSQWVSNDFSFKPVLNNFKLYFSNFPIVQLNVTVRILLGGGESVRRGRCVRMSSLCGGLRVLRGRFAVRGILELADENRHPHPRVLRHRLSARCRPFHLEVWQREGKRQTLLHNLDFFLTLRIFRESNFLESAKRGILDNTGIRVLPPFFPLFVVYWFSSSLVNWHDVYVKYYI